MPMTIAHLQALATKSQVIHVGALDPQGIFFLSTPSDICPDMTTVVSSVLWLEGPGASKVQLTAAVYIQTVAALALVHPFQTNDVPAAGLYRVYAAHTLAGGGTVRSERTQMFTVLDQFQ